MTLSEFILETCYNLKGTEDDAPASGDDDWNYWVNILNRKKDEWTDDTKQNWSSNFKESAPNEPGTVTTNGTTALVGSGTNFTDYNVGDKITVNGETVRTIATITDDTHLTATVAFSTSGATKTFTRTIIIKAGVSTYKMHRKFVYTENYATILKTDGFYDETTVVKPQERDRTKQQAYVSGRKPKSITFTFSFATDDGRIGGELLQSGYYRPDDVDKTDENADIPIDDPHWATMAVAAYVAFNDITYQDKFDDLNGQANNLYRTMAHNNRRGGFKQPRTSAVKVQRLRGFRN